MAAVAKYEKTDKIGEGAFGIVYKGRKLGVSDDHNELYAIKVIRFEREGEGIPFSAVREIAFLKDLQHPNIVRLCDVLHSDRKLALVFEFLDQDLKKLLVACPDGLDLLSVRNFLKQILRGLSYVHSHAIIHRDLKTNNLLINREGDLKIGDFGLARGFGIPVRRYSSEVVTLWYRPPDVLMGSRKYGTPLDMWSVGCILAEMSTGRVLLQGTNEQDQLMRIISLLGTPTVQSWPGVAMMPGWSEDVPVFPPRPWAAVVPALDPQGIDLLDLLMRYDPAGRVSAPRALEHAFLR